ncbi:MAG: hypothetical protein ABIJ16_05620 [Bacteroidota bacterium]
MKKFFKWFLIIIIAIIVIVLIVGLFLPKTYHVERSLTVQASYETIYAQVNTLKAMNEWSPWRDYDPDMKITYEGQDGSLGAKYHWEGNEDVGSGFQEITGISDSVIKVKVVFMEPMESESDAYINLEQTPDGIKVTWGFDGRTAYPMNIMGIFMDMDKELGKDFETGLARLDSICRIRQEDEAKTWRGYTISEIEYGPKTFVGFRKTIRFDEIHDFFAEHFGNIFNFYASKNVNFDGYPSGMYMSFNEQTQETDMIAAIPVKAGNLEVPEGYQVFEVGGKALLIEYKGAYNGSGEAHYAMDDYFKEKGLELNEYVIEEYVTDPGSEPDTYQWITNFI